MSSLRTEGSNENGGKVVKSILHSGPSPQESCNGWGAWGVEGRGGVAGGQGRRGRSDEELPEVLQTRPDT